VALIARHGHVRARQREPSVAMISDRISGTVKILDRVAALAPVLIRGSGKLPFVFVLVAIQAGSKFHFVHGIPARWNMTFRALYSNVLAKQRVVRGGMLFHTKK
jgi:hypothetical protein